MMLPIMKIISTDGIKSNGGRVNGPVRFTRDCNDERLPVVRSTVGSNDTHPGTILYDNNVSLSTATNDTQSNRKFGLQNNLQYIYNEFI